MTHEGWQTIFEPFRIRSVEPRRVYTQSHVDYVAEIIAAVSEHRESLPGYRITWEPPYLRHFTAHFAPV